MVCLCILEGQLWCLRGGSVFQVKVEESSSCAGVPIALNSMSGDWTALFQVGI